MLTQELLHSAADLLKADFIDGGGTSRFMCNAVGQLGTAAQCTAFHAELLVQDVGTSGSLYHQGVQYSPEGVNPETQALRFDFLNLLAEFYAV